ncbi:MAG TPA: peptide deformylase [Gammaproteobacteria bacterium]|nr:peptide deformylase [Gammaproteobacteria bacterium]
MQINSTILTVPDPLLRTIAQPTQDFGSKDLKNLIEHLFAVMQDKNGVGLAAPQIGISQRIFVYGFDSSQRYPELAAVPKDYAINPEIIWQSDELIDREEGCLSIPHQRGTVSRAKSITFKYLDVDGKTHERTLSDFAARIVQHEIDHLNGVLYIDRAQQVRNTELY